MKLISILLAIALTSCALTQTIYAVHGEGFFRLEEEGGIKYAKSGTFFVRNGMIVHASGLPLSPTVRVPTGASFEIQPDGVVMAAGKQVSRLVLATFSAAISHVGNEPFDAPSKPRLGNPGDLGLGTIVKVPSNTSKQLVQTSTQSPQTQTAAGAAKITLHDSAQVNTPTISLGQIAHVNAPEPLASRLRQLDLGASPRVSSERLITKVTIQSALRSARMPIDQIEIIAPEASKVTRAFQIVLAADLINFGLQWIATNLPDAGPVRATSSVTDRKVAAGDLILEVTSHKDTGKSIVLTIKASAAKETQFIQQVVFTRGETSPLPQVKPGQSIRVQVISNGVTVEVVGEVKSINGHQVTVSIPETKANLTGVIKPDGTVEVKL